MLPKNYPLRRKKQEKTINIFNPEDKVGIKK